VAEEDIAEGDLAEGDLAEGEGGIELAGERDKFTEGEFNVCFCTTIDDGEGIPIPDGEGIPDGDFFDYSKLYLICATHGAMYLPESGLCVQGPCPGKRLQSVPIEERDGQIFFLKEPHHV
jgi:hypothetical protein